MEAALIAALETFDQRSQEFREQVNALRKFKSRMQELGAYSESEQFSVPSLERLESPPQTVLTRLSFSYGS